MTAKQDIFFSIVIPLYNKEPHIAETLESVFAQTYQQFEVVVVNDASTDRSREIVENFSDPRIRIIDRDKPGAGGAAARNRGIKEAKYEHIAFLDADDVWKPEHLELMVALIKQFPDAGFYTGGWILDWDKIGQNKNVYSREYSPQKNHKINLTEFLKLGAERACPVCTIVAVVQKKMIQKIGGFPEDKCLYGVDIDTWLRIMMETDSLAISPQIHAIYNRNAINMVSKAHNLEVIKSCIRMTADARMVEFESKVQIDLKRFVNSYQFLVIRRRAMTGILKGSDLQFVYRSVNRKQLFVFKIFSMLPGFVQKLLISFYNSNHA